MKKVLAALLFSILLLSLGACSAAPQSQASRGEGNSGTFAAPATTTATFTPRPTITVSPSASNVAYDIPTGTDRMVVRNGNLQLVVSDISAALDQIGKVAATFGGYVVSSSMSKVGERTIGLISIRVQASSYDQTIAALRSLALDVVNESTTSQDVTQEYVDLTSRLKNLQATEAQLLKIMAGATATRDVLDVQSQLTDIQGQIEQTKGRMQYLEQTSATSLISLQLDQAAVAFKINADKTKVGTGEKVQFQAEVSGGTAPYSYQWSFGDGATSNLKSPDHSYKAAGTYTVSLAVTDDKGYSNSDSRVDYINVEGGWSPGAVAGSAWNGLAIFGKGLFNVLIWLAIFSPLWIAVLIILYFSVWRRRKKV
jgi:PKD repeat protein